jgi:prepilin-type N-terminal cleavage/methylation domain-containing protein
VALSRRGLADSRGFTLTEVTVVIVLASVVTLGLVAFYLNSQAMWMDASTQALAQRDATSILEYMRQDGHRAALAVWTAPLHKVTFYDNSLNELDSFFWDQAGDSLMHHGGPSDPLGRAIAPTVVEQFAVSTDPNYGLVTVDTLRVRSTSGVRVTMSTTIGLFNQ